MESLLLTGSGAIDSITPPPRMGVCIKDIQITLPLSEVGSTDPSVTVSGVSTGAYTFHTDVKADIRFKTDEIVYASATNFSGTYSAVINYVTFGDSGPYLSKLNRSQLPLPSRLKRSPHSA